MLSFGKCLNLHCAFLSHGCQTKPDVRPKGRQKPHFRNITADFVTSYLRVLCFSCCACFLLIVTTIRLLSKGQFHNRGCCPSVNQSLQIVVTDFGPTSPVTRFRCSHCECTHALGLHHSLPSKDKLKRKENLQNTQNPSRCHGHECCRKAASRHTEDDQPVYIKVLIPFCTSSVIVSIKQSCLFLC